ncbi:MAG: hypothetical protein D6739_09240, partial [Nitrospirae bacterium]
MGQVQQVRGLEPVTDGLERRFGPGDAAHDMLGRALHVLASAARAGDVQASAALALFIMLDRNLKEIRDTGFDGTVSVELEYSPEPDRILEWVTEAYEKTAGMMAELG